MADDYVANVILFCEERAQRIALLVATEFLYLLALRLTGLVASPATPAVQACERAEEAIGVLRDSDAAVEWLHELPLIRGLSDRFNFSHWETW